jgi:stage II sporulation protein D
VRSRVVALAALLAVAACTHTVTVVTAPTSPTGTTGAPPPPARPPAPPVNPPAPPVAAVPAPAPAAPPTNLGVSVRVALATAAPASRVSATTNWAIFDRDGVAIIASGKGGETWEVQRDIARLRAIKTDGTRSVSVDGPLIAHPAAGGFLTIDGKRYRGDVLFYAADTGLLVVNRLRMEEYLWGVVPREIGPRTDAEVAAVQAQAVAARSYADAHLLTPRAPTYDLVGTVLDQVYGGADAETPAASAAVASTRGLVLKYGGMVVSAPYHAICGGSTAEPDEIWRSGPEPYLQRVSDRIPGTDRYYCDIAPGFGWTRTYRPAELDAVIARYLAQYTTVPPGGVGHVRDVSVSSHTASGRVGTLTVNADRGNFVLRGNDIRFVLRTSGGEILNSTYFSVESTAGSNGTFSQLTLRGTGNGHGVGMCQWGAIGRARAGQDFRTILAAYYPGTMVGAMP